jgi:hypothetical protein
LGLSKVANTSPNGYHNSRNRPERSMVNVGFTAGRTTAPNGIPSRGRPNRRLTCGTRVAAGKLRH